MSDRRLLLVHAHPDDETIMTGVTMAKYVSEGASVTLVTCTLGEMGEVLIPSLAYLAAEYEDALGAHRLGELEDAMRILGVTDHRRLGGDGRHRDSGMKWGEDGHATAADDIHESAFWRADLTEAATELVAIIREVRPHVLVTYDEFGNYGHPDHVQAHRVAHYGADLAAVRTYRPDLGEAWDVPRIYWTAMREVASHPDDLDAVIDGTPWAGAKLDALRAHATQIRPEGEFFSETEEASREAWSREYFRLAKGVLEPADGQRWEDDLFAGIATPRLDA